MQVYLPDELYKALKERGLPASELLQEAVEAELRRQHLDDGAACYVEELVSDVGEPSARERAPPRVPGVTLGAATGAPLRAIMARLGHATPAARCATSTSSTSSPARTHRIATRAPGDDQ